MPISVQRTVSMDPHVIIIAGSNAEQRVVVPSERWINP